MKKGFVLTVLVAALVVFAAPSFAMLGPEPIPANEDGVRILSTATDGAEQPTAGNPPVDNATIISVEENAPQQSSSANLPYAALAALVFTGAVVGLKHQQSRKAA